MGPATGLTPDVVVIGGGPVGQTAALLCAKWGLRVKIVEAQPQRNRVGSRAICQQREVLDTWDSIGAGVLARRGVTWSTGRTYYRGKEIFAIELKDRGSSLLPPFVNISQAEVEEELLRLIEVNPLIEMQSGVAVQEIRNDEHGVVIEVASEEGAHTIKSRFAIACCGLHSEYLRDQLEVDLPGRSFDDLFLICDIKADLADQRGERRFHFDPSWNPGRQVLIHEQPDSVWRIDWQVSEDFDLLKEEVSGGLDMRIHEIVGQQPYELTWRSVYRFQGRVASRFRVGSVFLAGDFAHVFAPFGARGLNSGVHDVENLAWKLAMVVRGFADHRLLDSYEVERRAAALENLEVTSATMRFLVPQTDADRQRRTHLLQAAAAGAPEAIANVDSGRLYEPFWYVDSPLTTPSPDRQFGGRPERGLPVDPVPGTVLPDQEIEAPFGSLRHGESRRRLRQLIHHGFTILTTDPSQLRIPKRMPVAVHDLHIVDPSRRLRGALDLGEEPVHIVIRPDGHIAAMVEEADLVPLALDRSLGKGGT
ncbi:FAD-dependent monooxygenase [Ferrimicrobium sp.]|uniref:FAD-dependent monooxygenase n=1 Tax=Ferrimicrobium sp. TaxID=2926050 RepID=UPI002635EC3A|nr:FAD-dependent monooxygenase [Ferrimicrobium sp.]